MTPTLHCRYMKRRCEFLDSLPAFNYNTGGGEYLVNKQGHKVLTSTQQLGSTLMRTMLKEVSDFCDPKIKDNWSMEPHQQVRTSTRVSIYIVPYYTACFVSKPPLLLAKVIQMYNAVYCTSN